MSQNAHQVRAFHFPEHPLILTTTQFKYILVSDPADARFTMVLEHLGARTESSRMTSKRVHSRVKTLNLLTLTIGDVVEVTTASKATFRFTCHQTPAALHGAPSQATGFDVETDDRTGDYRTYTSGSDTVASVSCNLQKDRSSICFTWQGGASSGSNVITRIVVIKKAV